MAHTDELVVPSKLIAWALQSDCHEVLLGSVLSDEPSWQEMRKMGIGFWFTSSTQLRNRLCFDYVFIHDIDKVELVFQYKWNEMEKLARLQYLKSRDPKACALLYIALNRLQVLAGLFKISKDEKDKPLVGFLSRNFQEEKNKAAALKNAYVLMGRHQLELAIAFFLLGGDTSSAVTVCAKNLGDEQLALVICQLIDGPGGPLERNLISTFLLPSAVEKGDHWLASLLEWKLGNYSQAFLVMLGSQKNSPINPSARLQSRASFMDPGVGQYCQLLVTRNSMRNAIGEKNATFLGRWATLMTALAFNRCGLPCWYQILNLGLSSHISTELMPLQGFKLEALESLSSPLGTFGSSSEDSMADAKTSEALDSILEPLKDYIHKWVSRDVAFHLESNTKFDMAMRHISRLLREHPSCPSLNVQVGVANACSHGPCQYKTLIDNFQNRLFTALASFEQRFSLISLSLINKIFVSLCSRGFSYVGYDILHRFASRVDSADTSYSNCFPLHPCLPKLLLKATEETSCLFSRYVVLCSLFNPLRDSYFVDGNVSGGSRSGHTCLSFIQDLMQLMWSLRAALHLICCPSIEDDIQKCFTTIDFFEYFVHIASAWLQRSYDYLIMMVEPLFTPSVDGQISYKIDMKNLRELVQKASDLLPHDRVINEVGSEGGDLCSIPENARWKILGACLWRHMFKFMEQQLHSIYGNIKEGHVPVSSEPGSNSIVEQSLAFSLILAKSLETTLAHVSFYHAKQLASLLRQKALGGLQDKTLLWLRDFTHPHLGAPHRHLNHDIFRLDAMNSKMSLSLRKRLWDICVNPKIINEVFSQENISWSEFTNLMPSKGWIDEYSSIMGESKADEIEGGRDRTSASTRDQSPTRDLSSNNEVTLGFRVKDTTLTTGMAPFQNPKEVYKKNGELLEALCINSTDQCQAALATNKKGIVFFHWVNESPVRDQSEFIWSDAEWPKKGWAASESTPLPTCISPGVGLGKKRGVHLGLGGATVGAGPLARPGRDLTGGGAFGIPGYAGIGSSGLGWGIQEDFEELIDKPATLENINTRAFSSHPSRPFFLVGSSNTHIYLWEFGKDKATATYGVLPATNVPPPYALASISALQFDQFGQRFATAGLDGTVCTWQLELSTHLQPEDRQFPLILAMHPAHTDVTYVTSSGSIIAAAGYNSNNVNVVIWDMLAPPTASRASILCHEGGACSISVFKDDIGSGSISPLIVTGGKGGDVAVHDFRYIATGKSKQQSHSKNGETNNASLTADMQGGIFGKKGDQSQNGILWYIPKAHSASVTRIASIPNTSLFLTGSKDGDIKLWDVQKSRIVFHWPKLHERHTFIQPSTRGFGGVVRAGVTDIQVISQGFLSCGGDGSVKLIKLGDLS
ncbi:WD40 repeat [Dillenia turbinata]|uniref:WD40 repeat n=1 Tax=Dillenia turbinata TaxID=194707 RepID=A0AAN8UZS7_9MAGN